VGVASTGLGAYIDFVKICGGGLQRHGQGGIMWGEEREKLAKN